MLILMTNQVVVSQIEKVKDMFELQVLGDGKTKGEVSDAYGSTRLKGTDPSAHGKLDPSHDFIKSVMPSREELDREETFDKAKQLKEKENEKTVQDCGGLRLRPVLRLQCSSRNLGNANSLSRRYFSHQEHSPFWSAL
jgi:hypothetical protein